MKVVIDGKEKEIETKGLSNLEDLLLHISNEIIPENSLISRVILNGEQFSEEWEGASRVISLDEIETLEVESVHFDKFAKAVISDIPTYTKTILNGIEETSRMLRIGEEQEAQDALSLVIDSIQMFFRLIQKLLELVDIDVHEFSYEGETLHQRIESLSQILDDISDAQAEGDNILVADLIEFELAPAIEGWVPILEKVKEKL